MINEFEKAEQLRLKQKLEEYNMKCQRRLDELRDSNMGVEAELEEIHVIFIPRPHLILNLKILNIKNLTSSNEERNCTMINNLRRTNTI